LSASDDSRAAFFRSVIDQVLIPPQLTLSSALSALSFNKLVDLVSFAGLVETVNSATGVTLFAPNDGAFPDAVVAALKADKDLLTNVLTYHIASGSYPSALLTKGSTVVNTLYTVSNTAQKARVFDGKVNTSPLVRVDVPYNNGVFHVISSALSLPTNLNATFYSSNYNVLGDLVKAAGLSSVFAAPGVSPNYTVFAPTNEAFAALGSEIPTYLTAAEGKEDLATILTYHVVSSPIYSANIPASVKVATLQKEELTVTSVNGKVSVNAATVVNPDVIATNGVVQ
jgi:transforming growth factor-beta-induced protein